MSSRDEWQERHLTPRGWVKGSYRVDGSGLTRVEEPHDRVRTVRYSEFATCGANIHRFHEVRWTHVDENLVTKLLSKFGDAPRTL